MTSSLARTVRGVLALALAALACDEAAVTTAPTGDDGVARGNLGASTFAAGDVFVSLKSGQVQWRRGDGTLQGVLAGTVPGHAEGMGFDASGTLYVTHWCADPACLTGNTIERFASTGTSLGPFGAAYECNPMSVDFDGQGNVYVGQADCTGDVRKLDGTGLAVDAYDVATEARGSSWIELAPDGCTLHYTSQAANVLRYNACGEAQMTAFNAEPLPDPVGNALRLLPGGGCLIANNSVITRLDAGGRLARTYSLPGEPGLWFGVDLDVDGKAFWASNFGSGTVAKFALDTGAVLVSFNTGTGPNTVKAVAVARAPGAVVRRGRMTGGGSVFLDVGTRVTHGFELHCDAGREPNNLEINWHPEGGDAGGRFHLEELRLALCSDDPAISPNPPQAPFDTYQGEGEGSVNGEDGGRAEWVFTDAGEPGVNDRIRRLVIRDAGGNVVLVIEEPGKTLTYGNHQAHK